MPRNVIRVLRTIAIVMITLPEPVTTIPGILILCLTFAVNRQRSLKNFGNLEDLIKMSMQNEELSGFRRYIIAEKPVVHHEIKSDWFDNRKIPENIFHHTLRTSFPQYEANCDSMPKHILCKRNPTAVNIC
jgi:hypothetical protein